MLQLNLLEGFDIEQPEVDSDNWFTPKGLIEAAREVMGGIDLDPASCPKANALIKATAFYTKKDDGLSKTWQGKVWLNPPYSMPLIEKFTYHLLASVGSEVPQACILTRNATETKWCQALLKSCDRFCLLNKRVSFWHPEKTVGTDKCGHILFYFGDRGDKFHQRLNSSQGLVFKGVQA